MTTLWLVTLYLVAAACEILGITLAVVELRRVIRKAQARLGKSEPWDTRGQGAYDDIKDISGLRLLAIVSLVAGVVFGTIGNVVSALAG